MTRRKRGYQECLCKYCAPSGSKFRRWVKDLTRRNDRIFDKKMIEEQLND